MHPWLKGIQFCSNEKPRPFLREENQEIVKIHWRNLKIFFSRTTGPISTNLCTKYLWDKGIKLCSNEGPCPFPWVDNYEIAKISWRKVKNLLQNQRANFNQSWHNASLAEKYSSLFKFTFHKVNNGFFLPLISITVYWFELFSQVAKWPMGLFFHTNAYLLLKHV